MSLFDLTGKVAVITGASSGLGADAARAYAEYGANVALLARRKEKLDSVVKEIEASGKKAIAIQCDVTNEENIKNAVEEIISYYGKIDILLNNAGIAVGGSVEDLTVEQWNRVMDTNVKGIYLMCKYVIPHMKERKYGRIVNISSVNAIVADKPEPLVRHVYNASKSAVIGLTIGMAVSLAEYGITVNAIGPGLFESEMTSDTLFKNENFLNMYNSLCPSSRPGEKGELNGPILFFSSDAVSYTTGQFITVDGGFTLV
ncbi:SDR family oxidoreductase [Thermoanaerobacterium thermosaccharolyticum]|uniref:SDR family NAD(P)-dependent oxidoreductase n=1 Tax=Thermoanaerobacterium thermosaccharolyticum TaxID=1517 RepID=UPI003DA87809